MKKTVIRIAKMDCPSEIKMIEGMMERTSPQSRMEFDLQERAVTFYHDCDEAMIINGLESISLPGEVLSSSAIEIADVPDAKSSVEAKTLKYLLGINLTMFFVEVFVGLYAESTGLVADGLDMLADSLVYGVSLYAVGRSLKVKNQAAYLSGVLQISLGVLCLLEVARKLYFGSEPLSSYMISISIIALIANVWCLALIHKHKDGEVHMKARWIFSANDVIVNSGVIVSGILVYFFQSNIPDLVIGAIVSAIVVRGGLVIIRMSNPKQTEGCG